MRNRITFPGNWVEYILERLDDEGIPVDCDIDFQTDISEFRTCFYDSFTPHLYFGFGVESSPDQKPNEKGTLQEKIKFLLRSNCGELIQLDFDVNGEKSTLTDLNVAYVPKMKLGYVGGMSYDTQDVVNDLVNALIFDYAANEFDFSRGIF